MMSVHCSKLQWEYNFVNKHKYLFCITSAAYSYIVYIQIGQHIYDDTSTTVIGQCQPIISIN